MTDETEPSISISVDKLTPNSELIKVEETTQLESRRIGRTRGKGLQPPYDPDRLASFIELNETHAMAIRKKARWEVGFGFDLVPFEDPTREEDDDFEPSEDERDTVRDFWFGEDSRWLTGPEGTEPSTPTEVLELARQDYHAVGWCALEILTQNDGTPVGLAHLPARTVRVRGEETRGDDGVLETRKVGTGYVQVLDGNTRYFGEPGDRYKSPPTFVDAKSGQVGQDVQNPANELIYVRNPSPLSFYYGIPDWVSAIRTITADEAAKDYNRDFFEFNTIPRMAIKVSGGTLTEESKQDLREMLYDLRGKPHRTVILEVDRFLESAIDEEVDITLEPLSQGVSEEMDFSQYREANEHDIAKVHEVPPILINQTETSNRSNSDAQIHAFATETIAPEAHKFAHRLYEIIHKTAFEVTDWTLDFVLKGGELPQQEATLARDKINAVDGAVTVNEARQLAGLDPLPDTVDIDGDSTLLAELQAQTQPEPGPGFGNEADRHPHAPPEDNRIGERTWEEVKGQLEVENGVAQKDPIETMQFDSSNLDEGLFDYSENECYISFKRDGGSNSLYVYVDVPTTEWSGLANASSHGSYHYDNIRLEYPYIEVTNFHDRLPEGPTPDPEDVPDDIPGGI